MRIDFNAMEEMTIPGMNGGTGVAVCDGAEEALAPGVMHICPQGSTHSIANTGDDDLVMLAIVVKRP